MALTAIIPITTNLGRMDKTKLITNNLIEIATTQDCNRESTITIMKKKVLCISLRLLRLPMFRNNILFPYTKVWEKKTLNSSLLDRNKTKP